MKHLSYHNGMDVVFRRASHNLDFNTDCIEFRRLAKPWLQVTLMPFIEAINWEQKIRMETIGIL